MTAELNHTPGPIAVRRAGNALIELRLTHAGHYAVTTFYASTAEMIPGWSALFPTYRQARDGAERVRQAFRTYGTDIVIEARRRCLAEDIDRTTDPDKIATLADEYEFSMPLAEWRLLAELHGHCPQN